LFNALVGTARAIVTAVPGTTRDLVTETVDLAGLRVTLADTAGLRAAEDAVEAEGVRRTEGAAAVADLVLVVGDRSRAEDQAAVRALVAQHGARAVLVANKADLAEAWHEPTAVRISASSGDGLELLRGRIASALDIDGLAERPAMTNVRHMTLAARALAALARARAAAETNGASLSEEFVLADLREARQALEDVTGRRTADDVLAYIFERFCVGK
jgi:tRNA modification GTPase